MPDFLARDVAKGLLLDNMLGFGAMCCDYLDIYLKSEVVMVHQLMEHSYVTSYVNFCMAYSLSSLLKKWCAVINCRIVWSVSHLGWAWINWEAASHAK